MFGWLFWFFVLFVVYSYALYPVLVWLLAQLRPKPVYSRGYEPTVTLLIAAYNEEEIIGKKLENALELDYPADKLQILVTNDGSSDNTAAIVRSFADDGVEINDKNVRSGKMSSINRAMGEARGEIIVFSDANNMYDPDYLREMIAPFSDTKVGGVGGSRQIIKTDGDLSHAEGLYWKYESFIRKAETRLSTVVGGSGEALAVRKELYVPPGDTIINDDFFIAMSILRQGYNVAFNPEARSYETVSADAAGEITRRTRIIAGRYQAMFLAHTYMNLRRPLVNWQLFSHKFTRALVPFAMIGALVVNVLAVLFPQDGGLLALGMPWAVGVLLLQVLFYVAAWVGNQPSLRRGNMRKVLYVPTFLVNSNYAALRGLYQYFTNQQGHLWERVQRASTDS